MGIELIRSDLEGAVWSYGYFIFSISNWEPINYWEFPIDIIFLDVFVQFR